MDLYVGQKEGVSLSYEDNGTKYSFYWVQTQVTGTQEIDLETYGNEYESLDPRSYTRTLVGPAKADNVYPLQMFYWLSIQEEFDSLLQDVKVYENNDGTVSLKCVSNGMFATWSGRNTCYLWDCTIPICTETGICANCRFKLTNGAITDLRIQIINLDWGDPEDTLSSSPDQVDEDTNINHSDTTTETTLLVSYEQTKTDTTVWEHAWGFELEVSSEAHVDIPFFGGGSLTTTATASYNGKYGTENSVSDTVSTENSRTVQCPPHTMCTLKFVAYKLDNYDIPFTALVERSQDDGPPIQWEETGLWRGVQAFNFETVYCTTSLETGDTNCPSFNWIKQNFYSYLQNINMQI